MSCQLFCPKARHADFLLSLSQAAEAEIRRTTSCCGYARQPLGDAPHERGLSVCASLSDPCLGAADTHEQARAASSSVKKTPVC